MSKKTKKPNAKLNDVVEHLYFIGKFHSLRINNLKQFNKIIEIWRTQVN